MNNRTTQEMATALCAAVGLDASTVASLMILVEPGGKISIKAALIGDDAMVAAICEILSTDKTEHF